MYIHHVFSIPSVDGHLGWFKEGRDSRKIEGRRTEQRKGMEGVGGGSGKRGRGA